MIRGSSLGPIRGKSARDMLQLDTSGLEHNRMRKILIILSCCAALITTGCTGDSSRPVATGEGTIRSINAIPTAPSILSLIEERLLGNIDYSNMSAPARFDDLSYLFNYEVTFGGDVLRTRIATKDLKVERDFQYTIVLTGDLTAPDLTTWEKPIREWEGTETVFEAQFAHTAESLGPIDVYFAAPGVAPAVGTEIGTLSFGEILPVADYAAGDYVVIATTAGNPGDVIFTSVTVTPVVANGFIISIFDATANDTGDYLFRIFTDDGANNTLFSPDILPTARFIHANATLGDTDVYSDELLTNLVIPGHSFRDVTGDIEFEPNVYPFTYTAAGNAGTILVEQDLIIAGASPLEVYLLGDDVTPGVLSRFPDRRPVETEVKFNFLHAAANHPFVDIYVVGEGTGIEDVNPLYFNLSPGQFPPTSSPGIGALEIYMTVAGEKTVIAGPIAAPMNFGEVLDYISYDNVDPTTADIVLIPLP